MKQKKKTKPETPPEAEVPPEEQAAEPEVPADTEPDWQDRFLRAKADFANLQRRSTEELRSAVRYANGDFARAFLEVADDLERTLQAAEAKAAEGEGEHDSSSLCEGVKLIQAKFMKLLSDHNVQPISALGQPFNPNLHEALMQQPSTEHDPNTVIQEVQVGYTLFDRVLRPTRVIVSKAPEAVETEVETE